MIRLSMKYALIALIASVGFAVEAAEVRISQGLKSISVETGEGPVVIERVQDNENLIDPEFAKTSRPCPAFCIQPMHAAEGVETVAELEVLEFLEMSDGHLIDARTEDYHFEGTIPGSINVPYTDITTRMDEFGCQKQEGGTWQCKEARELIIYCNGPWCGQSPTAIRALIRDGYPAEKLFYYRGGMQAWHSFGLTVVEGGF